jgi:hypothetical protein
MRYSIIRAAIGLSFILTAVTASLHAATPQPEVAIGRGLVTLETESSAGISVRIAEEIARLVNV